MLANSIPLHCEIWLKTAQKRILGSGLNMCGLEATSVLGLSVYTQLHTRMYAYVYVHTYKNGRYMGFRPPGWMLRHGHRAAVPAYVQVVHLGSS